jgi:hypothetical protein
LRKQTEGLLHELRRVSNHEPPTDDDVLLDREKS